MKPKKIVIVEDEVSQRNILEKRFLKEGFLVVTAKNGSEGLSIILREKPDLIMVDVIMPDMDGTAMIKKLREDDWGKKAKVIVLTNSSEEENLSKLLNDNVFDYLIKTDWKLDAIVKKVHACIE